MTDCKHRETQNSSDELDRNGPVLSLIGRDLWPADQSERSDPVPITFTSMIVREFMLLTVHPLKAIVLGGV